MKKVLVTLGGIALILILGYIYHINTLKEGVRLRDFNPFGGSSSTTTSDRVSANKMPTIDPLATAPPAGLSEYNPSGKGGGLPAGVGGQTTAPQNAPSSAEATRLKREIMARRPLPDAPGDGGGSPYEVAGGGGSPYEVAQPGSTYGSLDDGRTARLGAGEISRSGESEYDQLTRGGTGGPSGRGVESDYDNFDRATQVQPGGGLEAEGIAPAGTDWEAEGFA